jgi:hypothetical protein
LPLSVKTLILFNKLKKMKKIILQIALLFIAINIHAQTANIMLCNASGSNCTAYTTLQDAYTAAVNGDVIYLPSGTFTMPSSILKEIKIFGVGANLDSSIVGYGGVTNIVNGFNLAANNIWLEGLVCAGVISICDGSMTSRTITGINVRYCKLNTIEYFATSPYGRMNNSFIIGCYFTGYLSGGLDNTISANTTEDLSIQGNANLVSNCVLGHVMRMTNSTVTNCIFNYVNWAGAVNTFNNGQILNSIFLTPGLFNCNYYGSGNNNSDGNAIQNCYFQNIAFEPIFIGAITGTVWGGFNTVTGGGLFTTTNVNFPFDPSRSSSPNIPFPVGNTADVTVLHPSNLGINGGMYPWHLANGAGHECVPSNPHIYFKDISNATNTSGNLPVQIKVRLGN